MVCEIECSLPFTYMNTKPVNEDTLDRLAKTLMVRHGIGYAEALRMLATFRLNIVCDKSIGQSQANQAALLTAINTGKRSFHGGVTVLMPHNIQCLLNWPGGQELNDIAVSLGATLSSTTSDTPTSHTLYIGHAPTNSVDDALIVVSSGWRGGVSPVGTSLNFRPGVDFATGGVAAGSLGVAQGFLRLSGLSTRPLEAPQGISLWRPDLDWLLPEAEGPGLQFLPKNLWMLGLGHLGQAFLWNFGLLPYASPQDAHFVLQDFDHVVEGNFSSQLFCDRTNTGKRKTRICAQWLEDRGFQTTIEERPFDANTKRNGSEPFIACVGFDAAEPRRMIESAGFDLVVECALGADATRFDRIILHTFPDASQRADAIWAKAPSVSLEPSLVNAFSDKKDCGVLAETLARKSIATAFVGAFAGALVAGELLKALHNGDRAEYIQLQIRNNDSPRVVLKPESYITRVARSGFTHVQAPARIAA